MGDALAFPRDLLSPGGQAWAHAVETHAVIDLSAADRTRRQQLADDPSIFVGAQLSPQEPPGVVRSDPADGHRRSSHPSS
jgi:hypothetical protein